MGYFIAERILGDGSISVMKKKFREVVGNVERVGMDNCGRIGEGRGVHVNCFDIGEISWLNIGRVERLIEVVDQNLRILVDNKKGAICVMDIIQELKCDVEVCQNLCLIIFDGNVANLWFHIVADEEDIIFEIDDRGVEISCLAR